MADQFPEPEPLELIKINEKIYMTKGGIAANMGFFITKESIIAIDAKMDKETTRKSIEKIKKITSNPITHMIITHGDIDHVYGLDAFPKEMTIISHPATRDDMKKSFSDPTMQHLTDYIPNKTFTDNLELNVDDETIQLIFVAPAHTSGDILVYFPDYKTVFVGDLVFMNDPLIHLHKGGSSFGLVKCLQTLIDLDADIILGGHIESADKKQVLAIMNNITEKQDKITSLIKEGKNLEEIKDIYNIQDIEPPPGVPQFPSLVETLFKEISQKA